MKIFWNTRMDGWRLYGIWLFGVYFIGISVNDKNKRMRDANWKEYEKRTAL